MKYLIVGLGNPGDEYANTRHNVGFLVLDCLASKIGGHFSTKRYAELNKIKYKSHVLILVKPNTYMNLSGYAVRYWLKKENVTLENLLIVLDDIDLPQGQIRLKAKGSGGSHNGLNHVIQTLGTEDFPRLRIGIGSDFPRGMQVDYVLGRWSIEEEKMMKPVIFEAADAILSFVNLGIEKTMNMINTKKNSPLENQSE
ncbi:MAG: Peptidyl-tRNA hydrolase [Bacteroidetes bacterium 38_7]|nr:MAG: Peptidyl-tRNA hydrolase [Bacteroidetes bacterium 38_7]